MTRSLALHAWGPDDGRRAVCLHGVTSWGGHFAPFAARALDGYRVLAPDLLGHGSSPSEPPWSFRDQLAAVLATVGEEPATWIGHSFGGRLAFELAATRPELVERLVLLDPALNLQLDLLLLVAEDARTRKTYASFDDLADRRFEESFLARAPRELVAGELRSHTFENDEGRWEYRYVQAAVVAIYAELACEPPPSSALRASTLLVAGEDTYLTLGPVAAGLHDALGDRFRHVTVPGGHTVLWDALPETAEAVRLFLAEAGR